MTAEQPVAALRDLLARRYGFDDFADVRPPELLALVAADANAVAEFISQHRVAEDARLREQLATAIEAHAARFAIDGPYQMRHGLTEAARVVRGGP